MPRRNCDLRQQGRLLRASLKNSGAGLRPAMNGRLARENTGARRPEGRRDACPTTFSKHVLSQRTKICGRAARASGMRALIEEIETAHSPESLLEQLRGEPGLVLLHSASFDSPQARYSFATARPFLTLRSFGSQCELRADPAKRRSHVQF